MYGRSTVIIIIIIEQWWPHSLKASRTVSLNLLALKPSILQNKDDENHRNRNTPKRKRSAESHLHNQKRIMFRFNGRQSIYFINQSYVFEPDKYG